MTRNITRIVVATATRKRSNRLPSLLQSLQTLDVPQGAELSFVFVENDAHLTIGPMVEEFHRKTGWPARAILEPRRGIPYAHNSAIEAALSEGADWLAFVDEEEQVRHDWLRLLWSGVKEGEAQLGGGPVLPVAPSSGCSDRESEVLRYYEQAARIGDIRNLRAAELWKRFDVACNNCIVDLSAVQRENLRFDPAFARQRGEDTDFSRRAHRAGLKLAWVPSAIVTKEVPTERLNGAFVFERARLRSLNKFELLKLEKPKWAVIDAVAQALFKSISGSLRIAFSPVLGRYSYYRGLRAMGIARGLWAGARGQRRAKLTSVTGD